MSIDIQRLDMPRDDAIRNPRTGRYYVPTREGVKWIANWIEFHAAGGIIAYSEDQTTITLHLPVGCKFSIRFNRGDEMNGGAL